MGRDLSQFLAEVKLIADRDDADQRLDHVLAGRIFWRSRSDLQERVKRGTVLVNGRSAKVSSKLKVGDEIRVLVQPEDLPDQDPAGVAITTLHEDASLIVVDKQAGLVVHPTGRHVYDTLMNALHLRYRESGEAERGVAPHVVHRLDRDTSGVLVVAKTMAAKRALSAQFEEREPEKSYLALVVGRIEKDAFDVDLPLRRDETAEVRLKMHAHPEGAPSFTRFQTVERFAEHALVRALPRTGRQHQIRVHLAAVGHPIVCDPLYGDPRSVGAREGAAPLLERQALHAESLALVHPDSGALVRFRAPLAPDLAACLDHLRQGRALIAGRDVQSARWGA